MGRWFIWALAFGACVGSLSCGEKQDPFGASIDGDVTYESDVKAILDASCIACHATDAEGADRNGAPAGVNFDTYAAAVESADLANSQIQPGGMPPTSPLKDHEKAVFQAWIDQGMNQ
jgi:uncharacterized membrane protein